MYTSLHERYQKEIRGALMKQLGLKNPMQVPKIEKVCINIGMGSYLQSLGKKDYSAIMDNITRIAGQKPVVKHARLSVSNFKLREGQPVGMSVTLRGEKAYDFLDKLINVVYPRVRDFRGVKRKSFDKFGNCSFGFNDHTVFPEVVQPESTREIHGLQVVVVTSAKDEAGGRALMEAFSFPFKK